MTVPEPVPEPCPMGRTDYEECFAPFRYCPVKGCGRSEAVQPEPYSAWCPACGERFTNSAPLRVVEHVASGHHVFDYPGMQEAEASRG